MQKKVMAIVLIVVAVLAILNLAYDDGLKPDGIFPMANQKIEWTYANK